MDSILFSITQTDILGIQVTDLPATEMYCPESRKPEVSVCLFRDPLE